MEGLVAMSVLKEPRCHQPQNHNGVGAASEGCLGTEKVSITWWPWWTPSLWDQLGCPQWDREPMECLVTMSVL